MLRVTKETEYAFLLIAKLAECTDGPKSATLLAQACNLPLPVSGKVLKKLLKAGILLSQRGANGGYLAAKKPEEITVLDVVYAMEGPVAIVDCMDESEAQCERYGSCHMSPFWESINDGIMQLLASMRLSDIQAYNQSKLKIMNRESIHE